MPSIVPARDCSVTVQSLDARLVVADNCQMASIEISGRLYVHT